MRLHVIQDTIHSTTLTTYENNSGYIVHVGVDEASRDAIVSKHNELRARPSASDMTKMVSDEN